MPGEGNAALDREGSCALPDAERTQCYVTQAGNPISARNYLRLHCVCSYPKVNIYI